MLFGLVTSHDKFCVASLFWEFESALLAASTAFIVVELSLLMLLAADINDAFGPKPTFLLAVEILLPLYMTFPHYMSCILFSAQVAVSGVMLQSCRYKCLSPYSWQHLTVIVETETQYCT